MKNRFLKPLIILTLITPSAFGAEKNFSWSELVTRAKESNEELLASQRSLQSSRYQSKGSYYNYYPQITASASAARGSSEDYSVSLSASQNLFSGFQDSGKIAQNKANLDIAIANLQAAQAKVSYDLKSAVADLIYAQSYVKLAKGIIDRRELNLKLVQLRFDGGRENKGSLLLSKAYLEDARLDYMQSTQDLASAQSRLSKVIGEPEISQHTFADKVPTTNPPEVTLVDLQKTVLEVPSYKISLAQEDLAKASLTQSEAGFYPTFNLSASATDYGSSWYPNQDRWSVGATLTLPLFNGGRDYYSTRGAQEALKSSSLSRSSALKEQVVKLKDAYDAYAQAVQRLKVDGAYLSAAEAREKISRQKYNNGLATFDEWDLIESDLIKRQKSYLTSERNRIITEAAWEQAQGKGVL